MDAFRQMMSGSTASCSNANALMPIEDQASPARSTSTYPEKSAVSENSSPDYCHGCNRIPDVSKCYFSSVLVKLSHRHNRGNWYCDCLGHLRNVYSEVEPSCHVEEICEDDTGDAALWSHSQTREIQMDACKVEYDGVISIGIGGKKKSQNASGRHHYNH